MPRRRAPLGPRLGRATPEPSARTLQQQARLARRAELREQRGRPRTVPPTVRTPAPVDSRPRAVEPDLDPTPPAGRPGPLPPRYLRAPEPAIRPDIHARFQAVVARALAKPLPPYPE